MEEDTHEELENELEYVHVAGEEILPLPLDKGYAWVITFACLMNSFIVDGIANSFGLMLPDFCNHFDADKSSVTFIGSLLCGVYLLVGPIVGALVNKFGCRPVCIAGSLVSSAAFICSSYASSLAMLTLSYGVVGGIGFGLIYLPTIVCVNFYFEKYRPIAMGLAVCGTGVGTIVMGPVTKILLEGMGWQNTMIILGGIVLNGAVFGSLMRPNEPQVRPEEVNTPKRRHKLSVGETAPTSPSKDESHKIDALAEEYVKRGRGNSEGLAPRRTTVGDPLYNSGDSSIKPDFNTEAMLRSMPSIVVIEKRNKSKFARASSVRHFDLQANTNCISTAALADLKRPLYRKDIFYSGSVMHLGGSQIRRSQQTLSPSMLMLSMTRIPGEYTSTDKKTGRKGECQKRSKCLSFLPRPIVDGFLLMTDAAILKNPNFVICWIGNLICMMAFYVPLFFVTDFSRDIGVTDNESKYLNSAFGAANTLSRILIGIIAGQPNVSPLVINSLSMLLCGGLSFLLNFCSNFVHLIIVYTLLGVTLAPIITLTSEILCLIVGLDNLTNAIGYIILARGLSTCIGSPLTASLYNEQTRYYLPFTVGGALFAASSVIFSISFLPALRRRQQQTRTMDEQMISSVQNLGASLMLVEGTQVMVSSVDLSTARKRQAGTAGNEEDQGLIEVTV